MVYNLYSTLLYKKEVLKKSWGFLYTKWYTKTRAEGARKKIPKKTQNLPENPKSPPRLGLLTKIHTKKSPPGLEDILY